MARADQSLGTVRPTEACSSVGAAVVGVRGRQVVVEPGLMTTEPPSVSWCGGTELGTCHLWPTVPSQAARSSWAPLAIFASGSSRRRHGPGHRVWRRLVMRSRLSGGVGSPPLDPGSVTAEPRPVSGRGSGRVRAAPTPGPTGGKARTHARTGCRSRPVGDGSAPRDTAAVNRRSQRAACVPPGRSGRGRQCV